MDYEIKDFQADVVERSKSIPVLVDFRAAWCGPCKTLGPILEKLAHAQTDRWALATVDTEAHPDLARQFGIRSIPAVKLFIDGAVTNEFAGAIPEQQIVRWLEKSLPGKFKKEIEAAQREISESRVEAARARLRSILSIDSTVEEARVLLARTMVTEDLVQAELLVGGIEEHSEFYASVDAIRSFAAMARILKDRSDLPVSSAKDLYVTGIEHIVAGRFDDGVTNLIQAIRADRYFYDDAPRKACVAVFQFLGENHDVTIRHRRDFGSALYI